jgi:hypothetical protein
VGNPQVTQPPAKVRVLDGWVWCGFDVHQRPCLVYVGRVGGELPRGLENPVLGGQVCGEECRLSIADLAIVDL